MDRITSSSCGPKKLFALEDEGMGGRARLALPPLLPTGFNRRPETRISSI